MKGQIELLDYLSSFIPKKIDILEYIQTGHKNAIGRTLLSSLTGLSDRKMRNAIHFARRETPILNLSKGDGYFIPDINDPIDQKMLIKFVQQEESRLKSIGWALRGARKLLKNNGLDWRRKDAA